ncbi:1412_t:CDS:1, partial [Entrophospora sp. SA101]
MTRQENVKIKLFCQKIAPPSPENLHIVICRILLIDSLNVMLETLEQLYSYTERENISLTRQ